MCRDPSEFRCGSKLMSSLRGAKAKQMLCAVDHTTSSLIRRTKGHFLRRIAKKNIWSSGACRQPLQCEPLCSCESGQLQEESAPIYNQFTLADTFHILRKSANFPQERRYPWLSKLFGYQSHEGEVSARPTLLQTVSLNFKI